MQAAKSILRKLSDFCFGKKDESVTAQATSGQQPVDSVDAEFSLCFHRKKVGRLSKHQGVWTFVYDKGFETSGVRTITEFPLVDKVYESPDLWPFFVMRIPSLKEASVVKTLEREHIDPDDEVMLLKRFGKRTIANPFELVPKEDEEVSLCS